MAQLMGALLHRANSRPAAHLLSVPAPFFKRDEGGSQGSSSSGAMDSTGNIVGLVVAIFVFVIVGYVIMRQRSNAHRAARNAIYAVPAVRREMMNSYARAQETHVRRSHGRNYPLGSWDVRAGRGGRREPSRSGTRMAGYGTRQPDYTVRAGSREASPPPSYYADVAPPPIAQLKPEPGVVIR